MSALGHSSLRLADDLLSIFEDFVGEVQVTANTYRDAKVTQPGQSSEEYANARLEGAGAFLQAIGEAERIFHDRFVRAALDMQARDEELTG